MNLTSLDKLHSVVEKLLKKDFFSRTIELLGIELSKSQEPFVWSTVDIGSVSFSLPAQIKSCWIFVLRRDVPSGYHYHPNSIQHTIVFSGHGRSNINGVKRAMIPFWSTAHRSVEDTWHVIGKGVPHEFFPEVNDMTVISFHTCEVSELEEVDYKSGASRKYEP